MKLDVETSFPAPKMQSRPAPTPAAGILAGVAGTLLLLAGCDHQKNSQPLHRPELGAAAVRVKPVNSALQATTEQVTGTIRSKLRATLEAKVSGRISELPVALGQQVNAGDLLVKLDAAEIRARTQQVDEALEQARREWKRTSALFEQQAATRSDYDAAESRLRLATAALAEANAMSAYIEVLAPFAGVVTRKWVDRGDLAAPGKPLMALEDPSALQMEADVPEAISQHIKRGMKMEIRVDSIQQVLTGEVAEFAPSADSETRTFKVRLDVLPTKALMSGQFARLVVPTGESKSLRVPGSAIIQRGQLDIVFVAADRRAQLHLVKTGRQFGAYVEILAGLDAGDQVVIEGAAHLTDGQLLEVQ